MNCKISLKIVTNIVNQCPKLRHLSFNSIVCSTINNLTKISKLISNKIIRLEVLDFLMKVELLVHNFTALKVLKITANQYSLDHLIRFMHKL